MRRIDNCVGMRDNNNDNYNDDDESARLRVHTRDCKDVHL